MFFIFQENQKILQSQNLLHQRSKEVSSLKETLLKALPSASEVFHRKVGIQGKEKKISVFLPFQMLVQSTTNLFRLPWKKPCLNMQISIEKKKKTLFQRRISAIRPEACKGQSNDSNRPSSSTNLVNWWMLKSCQYLLDILHFQNLNGMEQSLLHQVFHSGSIVTNGGGRSFIDSCNPQHFF